MSPTPYNYFNEHACKFRTNNLFNKNFLNGRKPYFITFDVIEYVPIIYALIS